LLTVLTLVLLPALARSAAARPASRCSASMAPAPADAAQPGEMTIAAVNSRLGCIALRVAGAQAETVTIDELIPGQSEPVSLGTQTVHAGATTYGNLPWSCNRLARTFQATETLSDGTARTAQTTITTPSCASRLTAHLATTRVHSGYPLTVRIADRWDLGGLRARVCVHVRGTASCTTAALAAGQRSALATPRAHGHGAAKITITDPYQSESLGAQVLSSRPVLLATGDSEMQVLDELLGNDLAGDGVHVIGDARQSTAISSPFFFDWPAHAFAQVADQHPDVVAMFLGGNEGFRLGAAECCGADWSRQYAQRVEAMMRTYRQGGAAVVYWFLIPTPSSEPFVRVVRAVNQGIVEAAARVGEGIHVFDLRPVFSPSGRYIDTLTRDGQTITVHESDGFHLSAAADRIVAKMFIARLREDRVL
jgi:lysophospholipase L1-like esterase